MDITQRFKAGVMAVKVHLKGELDKNRILPKKTATSAPRDEFTRQAKDVCNKVTTLKNVLLENRSAYMRIGQHLKSATHMSDEQRDLIDRESEKFVTYYTQHLAKMRSDWKGAKRKHQENIHIEAVLELLEEYLRNVQQIYLEQKKYRVQHELETYRLLKLAADKNKIPVRPSGESKSKKENIKSSNAAAVISSDEDNWDFEPNWDSDDENNVQFPATQATATDSNDSTSSVTLNTSAKKVALDEDIQKSQQLVDEEEENAAKELSPEDVQVFEQENMQLYHELQGVAEEVEQIEKNVVDIAQLQDIFTEKVSLQQHNIERITNAVIGTTENVKDANEQIKQAIQRNAGLRVGSLFFLLVMSFALLFLDWYYD
ncbi:syntaxin-18 [Teleopsis dalmanni]|uniref:syntaxin-18 n=1 Tax=Teleopsis dalmanni TaxID=139649 RepID=UPI000D32BBF3|nr:syntaxin-18 [Teleopsis dalmanni]